MKVPSSRSRKKPRKSVSKTSRNSIPKVVVTKEPRKHPKFGTSKIEKDFASEFLDKLGIEYEWQFEAKDIGRFYDYALYPKNGGIILLELDGSYYHSDPRVVEEGKMNKMQIHNKWVDSKKDEWALMRGIPLIRIWEKDIRENPSSVMKMLKERLYIEEDTQKKINDKNKRHINKIK